MLFYLKYVMYEYFGEGSMDTPVPRDFLMFPLKATEMPDGLHLLQPSGHKHLIAFGFGGSQ